MKIKSSLCSGPSFQMRIATLPCSMAALGSQRAGPHPLGDEKKEASRRPGLHSKRTSVSPLAGEKVTSRTPVLEKGKVVGVRKASPRASPSSQVETPGPPCGLVDHRANTPDEGPAGGSVSSSGLEQTVATSLQKKHHIFFLSVCYTLWCSI